MTSLSEYVAEAVLELLQSVPKPDKADLSVCIERTIADWEVMRTSGPCGPDAKLFEPDKPNQEGK